MTAIVISPHARARRKEMGVTEHQIERCLTDPDTTYPGPRSHGPGRTCYQRGDIVVVMHGATVVTVLWHRKEGR